MSLFRRKHRPPVRTGHEGDDLILETLAQAGDLEAPRHWLHYLYFADEESTRDAAETAVIEGWQVKTLEASAEGGGWVLVVEQFDAVLTPERVAEARSFFERLAGHAAHAEYDGWEAGA